MIAAVVPSENEGKYIRTVLKTLVSSKVDLVIPVLNGCTDNTREIISESRGKKIFPLDFPKPLGIDVPRPIGAKMALAMGANTVVFVDGDMKGPILNPVNKLIEAVKYQGLDLALTDCYPNYNVLDTLAQLVLYFRKKLNAELGFSPSIGVASPCHGPHAISRRLLTALPLKELAIPPVTLTLAKQAGLNVGIAASIPHNLLGSHLRNEEHVKKVAETIIGDCIEAIELYNGRPRTRTFNGKSFIGYHTDRDFQTLNKSLGIEN